MSTFMPGNTVSTLNIYQLHASFSIQKSFDGGSYFNVGALINQTSMKSFPAFLHPEPTCISNYTPTIMIL